MTTKVGASINSAFGFKRRLPGDRLKFPTLAVGNYNADMWKDFWLGNSGRVLKIWDGLVWKTIILLPTPQSHIVNSDGSLADVTAKFNSLLGALESLGLLATN